jgi:dTDP-4-dehydrorhamnose reductase
MRVLIVGAGGQLGLDLVDAYADHDVVGTTRDELDIADEAAVASVVHDLGPALVVNAAAWTDVDGCQSDPDRAHRVNALGPWWLARACERLGATLVHVSTDYVFSGDRPPDAADGARGWSEFDPASPINVYGRSKWAGEQLIRSALREHHIVRTAWLCGARGANFVRTMLRLGREQPELRVVDDQVGSPTFTRDLAAAIRELSTSGRYGAWHRTNEGRCSWYDLAVATFELAGLDVRVEPIASTDFPRPARRPAWSVLDGGHATASGLMVLPHWREGLRRLLEELGELEGPSRNLA